jgi:hypothetical protein
MSQCHTNKLETLSQGHWLLNGKHIYGAIVSNRVTALRIAAESIKTWVVTHPSQPGFLLVRPVDFERIIKAGGAIVR